MVKLIFNKRLWIRALFLVIISFHTDPAMSQDLDARSPQKAVSKGKQRQAEKKKAKQQKELQKGIEKGKKRHMKLQTKNTKKMMKKSKKKAANFNNDRKEFFMKRWFRKKK